MSLPEALLWQQLRGSPGELKFRRLHGTGPCDLDFYCSDARLAIEIDGQVHERGDPPSRDAARDRWLAEKGIETMRIPAVEVLKNLEAVVVGILAEATARLPLHHPAKSSSPSLLGEGGQPRAGGGAAAPGGEHDPQRHRARRDRPLSLHRAAHGPPPRDELGEDL